MELKSANQGANWHPLTSLITFEPLEQHRVYYFLPILDGTPEYFSTVLHEITHLISARFGRFAVYLHKTGMQYYEDWQNDPSKKLSLNLIERRVIGAFTPLLEGLALYTQLDFGGDEIDGPHYSPLYIIAKLSMANHALDKSVKERFKMWRDWASAGKDTPLLEGMLLDDSREDLNFYLFGYFYIKALQAHWAQLCPSFSEPAVFLPFALKLITDHPLLNSEDLSDKTGENIIHSIHDSLISLSANDLQYLSDLFAKQSLSDFDHCDIYHQLESQSGSAILRYTEESFGRIAEAIDDSNLDLFGNFRACNFVYIYLWCEGVLRFPTEDVYRPVLKHEAADSEVFLTPSVNMWYDPWNKEIENETDKQRRILRIFVHDFLLKQEMDFYNELQNSKDKKVCLAEFITTFRSIPGICLWTEGKRAAYLLRDPWHLFDMLEEGVARDEMDFLEAGLKIQPSDRVAFSKAFVDHEKTYRQARAAGEYLLSYLVGDPSKRVALRQRMSGVWNDDLAEARAWTRANYPFNIPQSIPRNLLDQANRFFDLPSFNKNHRTNPITFADLIPNDFR